jgi:hypothetical protein
MMYHRAKELLVRLLLLIYESCSPYTRSATVLGKGVDSFKEVAMGNEAGIVAPADGSPAQRIPLAAAGTAASTSSKSTVL